MGFGTSTTISLVSNIRGILTSTSITQANPSGFISHSLPNLYDNEIIRIQITPDLSGFAWLTNLALVIQPTIFSPISITYFNHTGTNLTPKLL
jgi:hypothetical protein